MLGRKGQGELAEYVITFLISTTVVVVVYTLVIAIYNSQIQGEIRDELRQLEVQTMNSIVELYNKASGYSEAVPNNSAVFLGSISLNYPSQVARRNYEIDLVSPNQLYSTVNVSANFTNTGGQTYSGARLVGTSTETPIVSVTTNIPNLNAVMQGSSSNGVDSVLYFYKVNMNGTTQNLVTLGSLTMFASITGSG